MRQRLSVGLQKLFSSTNCLVSALGWFRRNPNIVCSKCLCSAALPQLHPAVAPHKPVHCSYSIISYALCVLALCRPLCPAEDCVHYLWVRLTVDRRWTPFCRAVSYPGKRYWETQQPILFCFSQKERVAPLKSLPRSASCRLGLELVPWRVSPGIPLDVDQVLLFHLFQKDVALG